jgi:hypothetical protein
MEEEEEEEPPVKSRAVPRGACPRNGHRSLLARCRKRKRPNHNAAADITKKIKARACSAACVQSQTYHLTCLMLRRR